MIKVSQPFISEDERKRVDEVLASGMIASGAVVQEFEQKFSSYIGCRHGIATSNGTTALHAALRSVGIGPGDKVLTTPFTFIASTNSIAFCGAQPVFGDIDPRTFNLDPIIARDILKRVSGVKAILLVHLYGLPCNMDAFLELRREFGIKLIEDCAQAHGAEYKGKKVGSIGDVATFSFYATKNLTTGEGGMVTTSDDGIAERCRKMINHGRMGQYEHDELGYNYRLTNFQAAIGIGQLEKLDRNNARRTEIAKQYDAAFCNSSSITSPYVPDGYKHVYHQYTIRTKQRDALQQHLEKKDIGSFIVYPIPNCRQPLYADRGYCGVDGKHCCIEATKASSEVLSIPIHPLLTDEDSEIVSKNVRFF